MQITEGNRAVILLRQNFARSMPSNNWRQLAARQGQAVRDFGAALNSTNRLVAGRNSRRYMAVAAFAAGSGRCCHGNN
jgi:hypothetical protein